MTNGPLRSTVALGSRSLCSLIWSTGSCIAVSVYTFTPAAAVNDAESLNSNTEPRFFGARSLGRAIVFSRSAPIVVTPDLSHQRPTSDAQPFGP